jgi:kinesin family protein C1
MEGGGGGNDENIGMIPRAVEQIYATVRELESKGWSYTMTATFLEIYNETLRDLLGNTDKKLSIRHDDASKSTIVEGASVVNVGSPGEVRVVLERAMGNRSVASTLANERSSRSHSVFTLTLTGVNSLTGESCKGVLNLIDLAGSERLSSSGSTGNRLKETQAINKSLSCVGDVIMALGNGDAHIPYRNSKVYSTSC